MVTANLNLKTSTVGVTSDSTAAQNAQDNIQTLDLHDHTSGKGVKVPTGGLNINADLTFNSNQATDIEAVEFTSQTSTISQANTLYVKDGELYYIDAALSSIQLTLNGSLNINTASSSQVFIDGGNSRGANLRAGTNDAYSMILETNNTDRLTINSSGLATLVNDFALQKGSAIATTGTLNDVSTSATSYFQFTGAGTVTVTGFANGADGKVVILTNKTGNTLLINNNDSGSVAANRILTGTGATISIANNASVFMVYDATNSLWNIVGGTGSGSSSGLYSTIDFETNTAGGISTFADGAVAIPVDGTGGSPNSTFASSSSSPLRGTYSGLFTKSGTANRQGEGFSLPITLSSVDTGKTIQVTFDWKPSSTMPASAMVFYVYDVTNAAIITPSQPTLPTGTSSQYSIAFNATTSTSYRLIWMISSTTTTDFTAQIDQITYGTVVRPTVAGIGDWINYTPTVSAGFGTVTNNVAEYRRVGDSLQIQGSFTTGTVAASIASITIPSTLTIDTTKVSLNTTTASPSAQIGFYASSGLANSEGAVLAATTTSTSTLYFGGLGSGTTILTPANGSTISTSTSVFSYTATVPIAQWSSGITLASTTAPLQFSSNSSTSDANDTTSFTYGAAGSSLPGTLTALRTKRVQLPTPYSNIDDLDLFILPTTDQTPIKVGNGLIRNNAGTIIASPLTIQNTTTYGVGIQPVSGSKTQIDVVFGQYSHPSGATFASAGANWATANGTWFVKNRQSIGAAELAPATELSQGTVGYSQWASYTPTFSAAFGTTSGIVGKYRREGDSMRIKVNVAMGVAAASIATMTIPGSYTIDSTKLTRVSTTVQGSEPVGNYYRGASAANTTGLTLVAAATSASLIYFGGNWSAAVNHTTPGNGNDIGAGSENIVIDVLIPISGWN